MNKVLIIGVSGLLGNSLYQMGEKYDIFGTFNSHKIEGAIFLDVTDKKAVFSLMDKIKPDLVIDTHSITNVDYCETHKDVAWNVNVNSVRNIAEACNLFGSKMVYISTDYVFDGKNLNYGEKDKASPVNYYAKTKLMGEKILEVLDVNYIIARTSVVYGYGGNNKKPFVSWVVENLKAKNKIQVVIDQFNNPTLVDDLSNLIYSLYEKRAKGLFHIVGGDCISRYEFAVKIAKHFKLDHKLISPITTPELNQIAPRPLKLSLSTKKLERFLGKRPLSIEEGLKRL